MYIADLNTNYYLSLSNKINECAVLLLIRISYKAGRKKPHVNKKNVCCG